MKYALLIYEDEAAYGSDNSPAMRAMVDAHEAFYAANAQAITGGAGLAGTDSATTVRTRGGERTLHDGPFAEAKEQLGGIYFVEADDLDAALALARRIPLHGDGAIEVRPLLPMQGEAHGRA